MRLLLDQHLSRKLLPILAPFYPGCSHVALEGFAHRHDTEIWDHAVRSGFVLVTKDEDFRVLSFARGHPPKVLLLRIGNTPTRVVAEVLIASKPLVDRFLADDARSLLELP